MTADKAGRWLRVSRGGQDESSQLPDIERWCEARGYVTSEETLYTVHAKSAYKGLHQRELDQALSDMAEGKIDVLVVWALDRVERRGALHAFQLAARARQAGGRVEYAAPSDQYLNEANDMSDVMLAMAARQAQKESERKSERAKIKQAALREAGSVVGLNPYGYDIELQPDGRKFLVPTDEGRRYIPLIFKRILEGDSVRSIATWLDTEGVRTRFGGKWNEGYLTNRVVKNPVYMGQRRNSGNLEVEALVEPTTWHQANAELAARAPQGRGTTEHPPALLKPFCRECGAPMYRVMAGNRPYRRDYYKCHGKGPQRKSCGARLIPLEELDELICSIFIHDPRPHKERIFVPGDDLSGEISKLREKAVDLLRRGDYEGAQSKMREAEELEQRPRERPHWETRETGQTEAEFFKSLDHDQLREYLARFKVEVLRGKDGEIWPSVSIPDGWLDGWDGEPWD